MIKGLDMKTPHRTSAPGTETAWGFAMVLVIAVTFLSVLMGCGAQVPENTTQDPEHKAPKTGARVVALDKPNEYAAILRWEDKSSEDKWLIHRRQEASEANLVQVALLDATENQFEDRKVEPGATYTYFVSCNLDGKMAIRAQMTITVPRDFVVTGERSDIRSLTGINRLYLTANSKLLTGTAGISIHVNELHSDFGTIETFQNNDLARPSENGANAGRIELRAKTAFGTLRLANRGQGGASGMDARPGSAGAQGEKGLDGDWGMNPAHYKVYDRNFINSYERAMRSRPEPVGSPRWSDVLAGGVRLYVCARPPANGGQGKQGARGGDGGDGTDGGNAAWVLLQVENPSTLVIDDIVEGGAPGRAGNGAPGGAGGPGGTPGNRDAGHRCSPASVGPQGPSGEAGSSGQPGKQGLKQPVCIDVAGQKSEGCRHFKAEGA